ncbi:hypothetical protein B0A53_01968 [Rhodotorula sp. CCFEE 5036]|nr:hypothetical protein B0A53_01968 [Rhodotorula sp. CCFEE 5036]
MSRQRTPPEQVQPSATEAHTASRKHQLRHRSPRGQRGRPRVGLVGAASPSSSSSAPPAANQDAAGGSGTTAPASGSTRHRQRDKAALGARPQQHEWLLQMWSKYRKQVTIAAAVLVLVLIISAVRIAFHTADYSAAAVYPPTRPNRPVSSRKPSLLTLNPAPSIAKSKSKEPAAVVVEKEKEEEENEKVLHEALDSAVRHALEDAWQLPPHAPANGPHQAGAVDSDRRSEGDGGGVADPEQQPAPQRSLAELYADLEELGISAHELNEVLDEAMRSTGDR